MNISRMPLAGLLTTLLMMTMGLRIETATADDKAPVHPGKQIEQKFVHPDDPDQQMGYLLFLPQDYGKTEAEWPVILFLHGSGERGDNLPLVKKHGPPKIVDTKTDFPFVVISPQCPLDGRWTDAAQQRLLNALLDHLISAYDLDDDRIYLTGLSMGGYGTWTWGAARPERFAALVPICGGGDPEDADRLKTIPIWVFHGAKDGAVPIQRSEEMVSAIKEAGGTIRFTVYPDAGHDSWTETYDNPDLYQWLLEQKASANRQNASQ